MDTRIILTDVDGVLLNWEYAFDTWVTSKGYTRITNAAYALTEKYGISAQEEKDLVKQFNESAAIGFLPPLRDAMYYVDLLHRKHGYTFHAITSLSTDPAAGELRTMNLKKLFGETAFTKFVYLGTNAPKDKALAEYKDTDYVWVEDKVENAQLGYQLGLDSILIEHAYNMHEESIPLMKNWEDVYHYVINQSSPKKLHEY
tara:strand:+ start:12010 stop:12612 length:603 start_codon:yes stop_codon:yes gene_type:complete